jgi:hypothetical protein
MSFLVGLNSYGNQINNNVVASNVSVEAFDTFPTTSTGDATGNYNHLGIDGQGNNKWDFLNVSGTIDGGYNFWHSSSTQAPLLITSIDDNGLTIDRSTSGTPPLLSPPISSLPGDNSHINFSVNLLQPPYNMVFGDLSANPVYMTQSNGFYTTNELVYAFVTTPFQVQLFKNDANTNPIPPNTVPTGFPTANTIGLTIGIPVFAFGLPSPSVIKTLTLTSDTLSITNDPDYTATSLSDTGLTLSNSDATNIHITASDININGNAKTVAINENNMTITDASADNSVVSATNLTLNSNYYDGNPLYVIDMSGNSILVADNEQSITSNIYSGELLLQDGSTTTQINTGQLQLNVSSDNSFLNVYDLKFNGRSYAQNQVVPTLIYSSPVIYADGIAPATSLTIRNTYGYSGWFFQNISTGNKINWYFPACNPTITTVADLKGVTMSYFNGVTTTIGASPFIIVYTIPTGSGDYAPGFYHSSRLYQPPSNPTANTNYQACILADKSTIPFNYETQVQWVAGTTHGTYSQGDKILAVVIGSNSANDVNSCQFVVNKINLIYANFTQSYLLFPP